MPMQNALENLAEFGHELGLKDLKFDDNNTCILGIDDEFSLHLTFEPNSDRLYLYSPLLDGFPKEESIRLKLYEELLTGSMLGGKMAGGGVGIAVKEELILMHCTLDMRNAHSSVLRAFAPLYVETVEKWRKKCAEICLRNISEKNTSKLSGNKKVLEPSESQLELPNLFFNKSSYIKNKIDRNDIFKNEGNLGDNIIRAFIKNIEEGDSNIINSAVDALKRLDKDNLPQVIEAHKRNLKHSSSSIRKTAIDNLVKLKIIDILLIEALINNLGDANLTIRESAFDILKKIDKIQSPEVIETCKKNLNHIDIGIRQTAAEVLVAINLDGIEKNVMEATQEITLLSQQALDLSKKKDYQKAKELFEKALNKLEATLPSANETKASLYYNIGTMNYHLCNYEEAIAQLEKALDLKKDLENVSVDSINKIKTRINECQASLKSKIDLNENVKLQTEQHIFNAKNSSIFNCLPGQESTVTSQAEHGQSKANVSKTDTANVENFFDGFEISNKTINSKDKLSSENLSNQQPYIQESSKTKKNYDPRFLSSSRNESSSSSDTTVLRNAFPAVTSAPILREKGVDCAMELLKKSKILLKSDQNRDIVQIIFDDINSIQQFTSEIHKMGISDLHMKDEPRKTIVISGKGNSEDQYVILLNSDEYNAVMNDKNAYAKLISDDNLQPSVKK